MHIKVTPEILRSETSSIQGGGKNTKFKAMTELKMRE